MARYKEYSYKQTKLIPISFDHQSDLTDRKGRYGHYSARTVCCD